MAWTIPTYAGTYMGGSPSNARIAMFELCRAVNERQGAVGITKTQFYKADGTLAADLLSADLAGIRATGANSYAFLNLKKIRDAILAMVASGKFTESSGVATLWTKANLETAIGADLDADPIRPQEERYWQAMQDALDRLIYALASVTLDHTSVTGTSSGTLPATYFTEQDAWDARGDNPAGTPTFTAFGGLWLMVRSSDMTPSYDAGIQTGVYGILFPSTGFLGTSVGVGYRMQELNESDIDVAYSIGSASFSMPAAHSATDIWRESSGADTPAAGGGSIDCEITTTEPSTVPFSFSSPGTKRARMLYLLARIYIDLASVLTDQA